MHVLRVGWGSACAPFSTLDAGRRLETTSFLL